MLEENGEKERKERELERKKHERPRKARVKQEYPRLKIKERKKTFSSLRSTHLDVFQSFAVLLRLGGWVVGWLENWRVMLISAFNYVIVEVVAEIGNKICSLYINYLSIY